MLKWIALTMVIAAPSGAQVVYLTQVDTTNSVRRGDGVNPVETLVTSAGNAAESIALDLHASPPRMYWTDRNVDKLFSALLDGTDLQEILNTGLSGPQGVALDTRPGFGHIYFTDRLLGTVERCDLDGGNRITILSGQANPEDVVLDFANGKLYVANGADVGNGNIVRANFDGTSLETFISSPFTPTNLALDGTFLYWTDTNNGTVNRTQYPVSITETAIITGQSVPEGLALDTRDNKIYWADSGTDKIQQANLDGSSPVDFIVGLFNPHDIAIDDPATTVPVELLRFDLE